MNTWQRSRVPPKSFYVFMVFPIFQHGTATVLHTCAGYSLILYYIRRFRKPEYEMLMAYTFPLLNLTETDSFTKFCTKYLSNSNHTSEWTNSGSAAKTKQCRHARAKFYCTILNMHSLFQRIQINIIELVQLKTESRHTASVTNHAQYTLHTQHNSPYTLPRR
jgi:hypothetical protein